MACLPKQVSGRRRRLPHSGQEMISGVGTSPPASRDCPFPLLIPHRGRCVNDFLIPRHTGPALTRKGGIDELTILVMQVIILLGLRLGEAVADGPDRVGTEERPKG